MVSTKLVTAEELVAMGSDAPYELIEGELQSVSPVFGESSTVTFQFSFRIAQFVYAHKLGKLTSAEGGFLLTRNPDTIVAPDIGFIANARIPADYDFQSFFPVAPDLAVEVVSTSDRKSDIDKKTALYARAGTPLVWVVYPKDRAVIVHVPGKPASTLHEEDELNGGLVLPGFSLQVKTIFVDPQDG